MTEAITINNEELAILCDIVSGWGVKKWAENPGAVKKQSLDRLIAHGYVEPVHAVRPYVVGGLFGMELGVVNDAAAIASGWLQSRYNRKLGSSAASSTKVSETPTPPKSNGAAPSGRGRLELMAPHRSPPHGAFPYTS
jgi:hypothetical protein